ncbi:MAG: GNAT family N-acetyltransferase [Actinomycetota bacterium]
MAAMSPVSNDLDELRIRPADLSDAEQIAAMHVASLRETYAEIMPRDTVDRVDVATWTEIWVERLAERAKHGRHVEIADLDGAAAGFVYFGSSADNDVGDSSTGHIYSLYTSPHVVRRGIGSVLVRQALNTMSEMGFEDVTLWVVVGNAAAMAFYEHHGWTRDGARRTEMIALDDATGDGHPLETLRYRRKASTWER